MKTLWTQLFLLFTTLFVVFAGAQTQPFPGGSPNTAHTLLAFPVYTLNASPVTGATLSTVGVSGQTTYCYWAVANYQIGSVLSGLGCIPNANSALSGSNYNSVSPWLYPAGLSAGVDILRTVTSRAPSGACNCAVATGATSGSINDQSNSLNSYTVSLLTPNKFSLTLTNEVTGGGASHLILRQGWPWPGTQVADLSANGGGVTGSGTVGTIPVWSSSTGLGNSSLTDNGSAVATPETYNTSASFSQTGSGSLDNFFAIIQSAPSCNGPSSALNAAAFTLNSGCGGVFEFAGQPTSGTGVGHIFGTFTSCCQNGAGKTSVIPMAEAGLFFNTGTTHSTEQWGGIFISGPLYSAITITRNGGLFASGLNNVAQTVTNNYGVDAQSGASNIGGGNVITTDASLHVESPTIGAGATLTHHYGIYLEDQTGAGSGTNSDPWGVFEAGTGKNQFGGTVRIVPVAFATLPTCATGNDGTNAAVNDSTTNTWGATITGSGANHVLAYCDGTNWTVAAK